MRSNLQPIVARILSFCAPTKPQPGLGLGSVSVGAAKTEYDRKQEDKCNTGFQQIVRLNACLSRPQHPPAKLMFYSGNK